MSGNSKPKTLREALRGRDQNPRVGARGGDHWMAVSFRGVSAAKVREIQRWYRTGCFTQRELSEVFGLSLSQVAKACRVEP